MLAPWQHYFAGKALGCRMEFIKQFSVRFHPPGKGSSAEKVAAFKNYLHRTVEKEKETIEMSPWGAEAVGHALKALATAPKSVSFEVERVSKEESTNVHFKSLGVAPWEEYLESRLMNTRLLAVTNESQVLKLARDVTNALQNAPDNAKAVRAFALWDDEAAIDVLVAGLAAVPSLYPFKKLSCVANVIHPADDPRGRLFVYATFGAAAAPQPLTEKVFQAYPPGADPDSAKLGKFIAAVEDRIHQGDRVHMDGNGPDRIMNVVRALCYIKGFTAEFRVEWWKNTTGNKQGKVLRFKARRGQSWDEFNAIDFTETSLLKATSKTPVDKLSYAALAEVKRHQAVAIHCFSDDKEAVAVAIKALAAVPRVTDGSKLYCVPSFGRAGPDRKPVLRLYLRRYGQEASESKAESL